MDKNCENCFWYDQCEHEEACEDYDPLEGDESPREEDYLIEIKKRFEYSWQLVEEESYLGG